MGTKNVLAGFMPVLVKPRALGLLTKCERRPPGANLINSVFAMFDLANPRADRLLGEQDLCSWPRRRFRPPPLDIGIIKPQAEVFIGGRGGT